MENQIGQLTMSQNRLPKSAYTDNEYYILEQKLLFSNQWTFAGLTEDITNPGDFITLDVGLCNLIILKQENGELAAFHNVCRHRGTRLLDGKGHLASNITCPYHKWNYRLNGELAILPKYDTEFTQSEKSCLDLIPAQVEIWRGMIWVHPDIEGTKLQDWFGPIEPCIAPYQISDLVESDEDTYIEDIKANWKIVVENFIDHYHNAHLHEGSLHMYQHDRAESGFVGKHFWYWEPITNDYRKDVEHNAPLPLIMDPNDEKLGSWVPLLFPNTGLVESESSWSVFHIQPIAVDRTRVLVRTKVQPCTTLDYLKQTATSYDYWNKKVKSKRSWHDPESPLSSGDFIHEDVHVCEHLQKSLNNPYFEFGPSAKNGESAVRQFQQFIDEMISPHWQNSQ